jgi:hypothetical protein
LASLGCPCGKTLSSVDEAVWERFASFVLSPRELDEYDAALIASEQNEDNDLPNLRELWRCECGRIAVDKDAVGTEVQWYAPVAPELVQAPHPRAPLLPAVVEAERSLARSFRSAVARHREARAVTLESGIGGSVRYRLLLRGIDRARKAAGGSLPDAQESALAVELDRIWYGDMTDDERERYERSFGPRTRRLWYRALRWLSRPVVLPRWVWVAMILSALSQAVVR